MADGQADDSETKSGRCTPLTYRTDSDGDTSSDKEDAENKEVDEESADEFSDGTDEKGGDGIQDMSQLGEGAIEVKFQTVHQRSYQFVGKAQHVAGCRQPQGEIASAPQQQQQLQPASGGDGGERTDQAHLSTSTTCVCPEAASLHVPGTTALTKESTSSLHPRIPEPFESLIQSSWLPEVPMTGVSPAGTLCNFIKVEQHFGDVTVKGGKNLNIGGTQNVGTTPTNQEKEEKPLTAAQKIRKRTASRIHSWTEGMVETDTFKKVKEKLDRGATWVTIKGRPGEGKSTTAYMALKDQYNQGRQVYQVVSPAEFDEVITACTNPVILLDDIFGDLEFDTAEWAKWRPSLSPIVDVKHPDKIDEKDSLDISTKTRKVSQRTKVDQTKVKQTSPNKYKIIIILVGRDYVLKSSSADLGMMADYISIPQYVVEVFSQRDSYERRKIWRVHAEANNINFEESVVSQICKADCPHGFPHVCKMFVTAYEKDWTQFTPEAFFQAPIAFLNKTLNKLLNDEKKLSLFMAMIERDGKISGQEIEEDHNLGYKHKRIANDLVGSYLKKEDDTYMFDHPSIYDSVSFILSTNLSKFVIENCSLSFINQRLRLAPTRERKENVAGEADLVANIPWSYHEHLTRRFASEMHKRNLLHVLSHQAVCYSDFVHLLMDCLKTQFHMCASDIVKLTDNSSKQSFCKLLSSNKSHNLIRYIMETENISFTQSERRDILLGVCTNAASSVLEYISGRMELEVNARYGRNETTPLMLAAETRDSVFVNQILSLNPDLNARDVFGKSVFYYLCENGLTLAVEHVLDMGVEVNEDQGSRREHPLYLAIEKGHLEVVKLLVSRGCDVDNQKGLACAAGGLNTDMLHFFLDRGAVVDGSVVCKACKTGNGNIVEMLFEKGATVKMVSPNGDTPLLSSCEGNATVVSYLLWKGASVNQVSIETGDTPLHRAAGRGSPDSVDVLLKAGVHVCVQNNTGDTPLHEAAGRGSSECVDVLLKAGADVNVQNKYSDTPLHEANAGDGCEECVALLLKAGADVNVQNYIGYTPLHNAAATGWFSPEYIDGLVKAGADVNVQDITGGTPLHTAIDQELEFTEYVEVLLKVGADGNVQNNTGDTPLHRAVNQGFSECVDVLLKAGADVNVQNNTGDTPLHEAAAIVQECESTEYVQLLLKAGADVNAQNNTGDTPLHREAGRGNTECVHVLLKAEADVHVKNNTGDTPLHTAAGRGSTECVDVLLKAGARVNVQTYTGNTPLHWAAYQGSTECVGVLLKAGADGNVPNNTGETPLHAAAAAEWCSAKCVDVLLKAGADRNVQNKTGDTPLHWTAGRGTTECVHVLLKAEADVHVKNNTGDTPLHWAAGRESTECVDLLLKAEADVHVKNNTGDTPLHTAAFEGSSECVAVLLKAGADVHVQDNTCGTPLHIAAGWGTTECVVALLTAEADVDVQNNTCDTPLHIAAGWGTTECVDVLLKAGARVNVQNYIGDTPLHWAAYQGSTECVGVLLKAGADGNVPNNRGETPLHAAAAAEWASAKCVDMLLKAGADRNVQNKTGDTPLHGTAGRGTTECVGVLVKAGADGNVPNNTGETPLHAAAAAEWGSAKCVDMLLKAGAYVNVQNYTGETALHEAVSAEWGSTECVDVLLKAAARVNVQNYRGDTPLHLAAVRESTECVDVLLKAGADGNVQNKTGDTPLHRAAGRGSTESVDVLLKAGADGNVQNKTGDTPLHRAAGRGTTECVDLLLKAGADSHVQNNTGETPLHLAAEQGSAESVDMLRKAGADVNVQNNTGYTPLPRPAERGSTESVDVLLKARADGNV